jgi:hypothetical protein
LIRYSLICDRQHDFDGWFRSSTDFDDQAARRLLACPVCGSAAVSKGLMAPAVRTADKTADDVPTRAGVPMDAPGSEIALLGDKEQQLRAMLREVREAVTRNARDVGPRFAEVARQMHDGEVEHSSIYGRASPDEVRALAEDGIAFQPLPGLADDAN